MSFAQRLADLLRRWKAFEAQEPTGKPDAVRRAVFNAEAENLSEDAGRAAIERTIPSDEAFKLMDAVEPLRVERGQVGLRELFLTVNYGSEASTVAAVVAPKSRRVFAVQALGYDEFYYPGVPVSPKLGVPIGKGKLDAYDFVAEIVSCYRTHCPHGVIAQGEGLGLVLYCALALLAAKRASEGGELGACIVSSYEGRTKDADRWWSEQVRRGLAHEEDLSEKDAQRFGSVQSISSAEFFELGIVLDVVDPTLLDFARESDWQRPPLDVLLASRVDHIPDQTFLRYWVDVLEREGATDEQVARYLVDNGHGALLGVEAAPKRFVANKRDAFARFYGDLVEVD